jgi:hypothetical protein
LATGFVLNASRKELLMEFIATILTSWKVITKRKELFE